MKKFKKIKAFTLVEILIGCSVLAIFLISSIMLFTNFQKGFLSSETSAILLQDGSIFLGWLRKDLHNAISTPSLKQLQVTSEQLKFDCYDNKTGKEFTIQYDYIQSDNGGSIYRKVGTKTKKVVIAKTVSKLEWQQVFVKFKEKALGTVRLGLHIKLTLKDNNKKNKKKNLKPFLLETKIFPARMNRQFNQW